MKYSVYPLRKVDSNKRISCSAFLSICNKYGVLAEAVIQRCFEKNLFLEFLQTLQEITMAGISLLKRNFFFNVAHLIKRDSIMCLFPAGFANFFEKIFYLAHLLLFYGTLPLSIFDVVILRYINRWGCVASLMQRFYNTPTFACEARNQCF